MVSQIARRPRWHRGSPWLKKPIKNDYGLARVLLCIDQIRPAFCAVLVLSLSACGRGALSSGSRSGQSSDGSGGGQSGGGDASSESDTRAQKPSCTFKGFANPVAYAPSNSARALVTTDLTGDGRLDLVIVESYNNVPSLELLTNTGNGAFSLSALPVAIKPNSGTLVRSRT